MDGWITIVRGEQQLGQVRWTGVLQRGTWRFVPAEGVSPADQHRITAILATAAQQRDLRRWRFMGVFGVVAGWQGFAGTLGALEVALSLQGIAVDRTTSRWPAVVGIPPVRGVDEQAWPVAAAAQQIDQIACAQWALLAIRRWYDQSSD
jgi:hypothetical protein